MSTESVLEDEKPITPMWLLYNPMEHNPNPTVYDDINYIPHTTLKNPRHIRFPDQWTAGPNSNVNDKAALGEYPADAVDCKLLARCKIYRSGDLSNIDDRI